MGRIGAIMFGISTILSFLNASSHWGTNPDAAWAWLAAGCFAGAGVSQYFAQN